MTDDSKMWHKRWYKTRYERSTRQEQRPWDFSPPLGQWKVFGSRVVGHPLRLPGAPPCSWLVECHLRDLEETSEGKRGWEGGRLLNPDLKRWVDVEDKVGAAGGGADDAT